MSWSLLAFPLHELAKQSGLEWAAEAEFSRGVPDELPDPVPLVPVSAVLETIRESGCHGVAWFEVGRLPSGPSGDAGDLGEVSLDIDGDGPMRLDSLVTGLTFRKPSGAAALRVLSALTSIAGPLVVLDDQADKVFVIWPDDPAADWPW